MSEQPRSDLVDALANGINPCDFAGADIGCTEKFVCKPHREARAALEALIAPSTECDWREALEDARRVMESVSWLDVDTGKRYFFHGHAHVADEKALNRLATALARRET